MGIKTHFKYSGRQGTFRRKKTVGDFQLFYTVRMALKAFWKLRNRHKHKSSKI